ncbi:hypothetical protein POM88_012962 [Heracleum sosnowskyi]|uniref:Uncharacterized protein n=1 Tax=Heracleum sosnowskyi TaxID=360622 RepID=A0AAD8IYC7_9APIA|nr:hypothetical protein POM88_012962 [Heracleum sosnowskyi]
MLVLRDKALGARVKELISRANAKRNDQGGSCLYDLPPQDDDDDEVGGGEASGNAGNAGGSNSGNTGIQSQNEGNEETPNQEKKDAGATDEEESRILEALEASILRCAIDCINAEKDAVTKGTVDKDTVIEDAVMEDAVDKVLHSSPPSAIHKDQQSDPVPQQSQPVIEDPELAHAVSLSLKTSDQEKALRELGNRARSLELDASTSVKVEALGKLTSSGRLRTELFNADVNNYNHTKNDSTKRYVKSEKCCRDLLTALA